MLCPKVVFESVVEPDAPRLLRSPLEDTMIVSLQDHKIGILIKNQEGEPKLVL